jgi:hypothetical protein
MAALCGRPIRPIVSAPFISTKMAYRSLPCAVLIPEWKQTNRMQHQSRSGHYRRMFDAVQSCSGRSNSNLLCLFVVAWRPVTDWRGLESPVQFCDEGGRQTRRNAALCVALQQGPQICKCPCLSADEDAVPWAVLSRAVGRRTGKPRGLVVLSRHLPEGAEENCESPQSRSPAPRVMPGSPCAVSLTPVMEAPRSVIREADGIV